MGGARRERERVTLGEKLRHTTTAPKQTSRRLQPRPFSRDYIYMHIMYPRNSTQFRRNCSDDPDLAKRSSILYIYVYSPGIDSQLINVYKKKDWGRRMTAGDLCYCLFSCLCENFHGRRRPLYCIILYIYIRTAAMTVNNNTKCIRPIG